MQIDLASFVLDTKPHNHDANTMEVAVAKAKADMKHIAANTRERLATMVSAKLAELPVAAKQLAGENNTMKRWYDSYKKARPLRHHLNFFSYTLFPLGSKTVGVAYVMLQGKTQETYEELFCAFLNKCSLMQLYLDPRAILFDFEKAVISAIGATLDNDVQVMGCFTI